MDRSPLARTLLLALAFIVPPPVFSAALPGAGGEPDTPAATAAANSKLPIREIRLENGLRVFVLERSASPTFAAYYRFGVGAASDPKGRTGVAHLIEHMMFKGTRTIGTLDAQTEASLESRLADLWKQLDREIDRADDPFDASDAGKVESLEKQIEQITGEQKALTVEGEFDELMNRAGGASLNAATDSDSTEYYVELPSNRLEFWFRLESDRLLHPVFREFWSERDVVLEERRSSVENQAEGLAAEALEGLLFTAHPYRNPVVGWPRDVVRLEQDDAETHFRTQYSPSNCVMVLVGDVRVEEVERLARRYFAEWRAREIPSPSVAAEPEPMGERRAVIEFDAEPSLCLGWLTVPMGHPDAYALDVLTSILGGLASSRLDRTVVQEERIASYVSCEHDARRSGGYVSIDAYPQPEHTTAELEAAMEREIRRIQEDGVSPEELERAKVQIEVDRVSSQKSNFGLALRIGRAIGLAGTPEYLHDLEARLLAVTQADVQAVARRYLRPSRKCAVEVRSQPGASGTTERQGAEIHHRRGAPAERGVKHSAGFEEAMRLIRDGKPITLKIPEIGKDVERRVLSSGVTVFVKEDHSAPAVALHFAWIGGSNTTPVPELAPFELASQLLTEGGTDSLDPTALEDRKEQLGLFFDLWVGGTGSGASFWTLSRKFTESFALAMDVLMRPRLDADRLETIKRQYVDAMRRRYDDLEYGADLVENYAIYHDNPRLGYEASRKEIEAVTPEAIRSIWRRYMGRDNLYVTAVGDFDRKEMIDLIEKTFAPWRTAGDRTRNYLARAPVVRPGLYLVEKEVSAPAVSVAHQIKIDRKAPLKDHAALEILNDILGGSGFRSRLMERLRSEEGKTYAIQSYLLHDGRPGVPGQVGASYETGKESVARSVGIVVDEFRKMAHDPVSPAEVQEQIDAWQNGFVFRYVSDFQSIARMMAQEIDDRPYDYDRRLLDAVRKVTPADVARVAKRYLRPENLTISVFGRLTAEDQKSLGEAFKLIVLPKTEVFRGGYDDAQEQEHDAPPESSENPGEEASGERRERKAA